MNNENNLEKSISLREIFYQFKRYFFLIFVVTFVFGVFGILYARHIKKPVFEATATAVVMYEASSLPDQEITNSDQASFQGANRLSYTFKEIITSGPVINLALEKLDDESYEYYIGHAQEVFNKQSIQNIVDVTTNSDSLIIKIKGTIKSKSDSVGRILTKSIVNALLDSAIELTNRKNEDGTYVYSALANKLVVMEYVETDDVVKSVGQLKFGIIFALGGFVLSFGIVLIIFFLNDTYITKEDFENSNNLFLISSIPMVEFMEAKNVEEAGGNHNENL